MKVTFTTFDSIKDVKTNKQMSFETFDDFESFLIRLASESRYQTKSSAPLISPAVYKDNTTRKNDNVSHWTFGILDIDDYDGDPDKIAEKYSDYKYICYSTASSTKEHPKFRLIFPLTQYVYKADLKHFWFALNKEVGGIGDAQTKDLSRMFYVPSSYKDSFNFIFAHEGTVMNPIELMQKHKYVEPTQSFISRLPAEIQRGLIQHKMGKMSTEKYSWSSYRDCPFVSKKMLTEYSTITGTGWYHKLYGMMVSIAATAIGKGYPITVREVENLVREIDRDTGNWYESRPISKEAERAINFVFTNKL